MPGSNAALTFFCQLLRNDEFPVAEVVQDRTKVGGVPVNQIGPRLILLTKHKGVTVALSDQVRTGCQTWSQTISERASFARRLLITNYGQES